MKAAPKEENVRVAMVTGVAGRPAVVAAAVESGRVASSTASWPEE